MGRSKRHNRIGGQFAAREIEMLESHAYRVLSLSAHRALARIEIELAHHGGKDNGHLPVTYDDFQRYGIDRHSIRPALVELEALGFIKITDPGRAGNAEFRRPAKYRLTYKPTRTEPPTHDWKRIQSKDEALKIAKRARAGNRSSVGNFTATSVGLQHRNHGGDTHTTSPSGNSPTTLDISARGLDLA